MRRRYNINPLTVVLVRLYYFRTRRVYSFGQDSVELVMDMDKAIDILEWVKYCDCLICRLFRMTAWRA